MTRPECLRGEIWTVDFNPGRGSEQEGVRPALIIQNEVGNKHSPTTIVAVITRTRRKFPFTVLLDPAEGGLKDPSMVNLSQILTLERSRLMKKLGRLGPERITEVDEALVISLGIG